MGPEILVPLGSAIAALVGVVVAIARFPVWLRGETVKQQSQAFTDLRGLVDEYQEAHERAVAERERLERELGATRELLRVARSERDRLQTAARQLEANLRAAVHEQHRLELKLIELGVDPNDGKPDAT